MTVYLVDNSVWQRVARSSAVQDTLRSLTAAGHRLGSCSASLDEASYSARSLTDLRRVRARVAGGTAFLASDPEGDGEVQRIRERLFAAGLGRAAGVIDVQIAAAAITHRARVLHYDHDFDLIAAAAPELQHDWVVPRGTID